MTDASQFASRVVYSTFYVLSYGIVFPAVFIAKSIPKDNAAVRGFIDGGHAAIEKVVCVRTHSLTETAQQPIAAPGTS